MMMPSMPSVFMVWAVSWVSILTGVFATEYVTGAMAVQGALYGDGYRSLWVSVIVATVVSIIYSVVVTYIIFKVVDKSVGVRVDKRVEEEGLDIYEHGESAYSTKEYCFAAVVERDAVCCRLTP